MGCLLLWLEPWPPLKSYQGTAEWCLHGSIVPTSLPADFECFKVGTS